HCSKICFSHTYWESFCLRSPGMIRAVRRPTSAGFIATDSPAIETMPKLERTAAILVAAGRGLRAGSGGPKQYRSIGGQTVIFRAMEPFCRHPHIFAVQP